MSFTCVSGRSDDDSHGFVAAAETVLHAPSGTFIHNDLAGDLSLTLYTVKAVGIANLADVAEYKITRDAVAVTHWVRFHGGGELHVTFDLEGELVSLRGERVCLTANDSRLVATSMETRLSEPQET